MKVSSIYDKGSAPHREDGWFVREPFFGVVDGVSAPFSPKHPAKMFDGMSGGELVARTIESCAYKVQANVTLDQFLEYTEGEIAKAQSGILSNAADLAGATFAFAKVSEGQICIIQGGDCFALCRMKNGIVRITRNQVRLHDEAMNTGIEQLQRKIARDQFNIALEDATPEQRNRIRGEMWDHFYFTLRRARQQNVNIHGFRGYALLNGHGKARNLSFSITLPLEDVKVLLLFSDGMVPWASMVDKTDQEVAEEVMTDFLKGGLPHLLNVARGIEKRVASVNYTDSAEATAVALEF